MSFWISLFVVLVSCTPAGETKDFSLLVDELGAKYSREEALAAHRELLASGKLAFPALLSRLDDKTITHIEFQGAVVPYVPPSTGTVCFDILRLQIEGRWPKGFLGYRVLNQGNVSQWIERYSSKTLPEMRLIVLEQAIQKVKSKPGEELNPKRAKRILDFLEDKKLLVEKPEFISGRPVKDPFAGFE